MISGGAALRVVGLLLGVMIGVFLHSQMSGTSGETVVAVPEVQEEAPVSAEAEDSRRSLMGDAVSFRDIEPEAVQLKDMIQLRQPQLLQYKTSDEATDEWKSKLHTVKRNGEMRNSMRLMESIYYPASEELFKKGKNTGYIMVAVLSCCNAWDLTKSLLEALTAMNDPIHVVVIDDASQDGTPEKAAAMGYPVLGLAKNNGATHGMNRAWQYFVAHPELQSLFILNNDILVADGTFSKLHRCAMQAPGPGVYAPMGNLAGLGSNSAHQNCEHRGNRKYYGGNVEGKVPLDLRERLPESLGEYNKWLEEHTAWMKDEEKVVSAGEVLGFFMGFRKDQAIADYTDNILLRGGRNLHQEYWLFQTWRTKAYVCLDTFAFHLKAATLTVHADGKRYVDKDKTEGSGKTTGKK